MRKIEYCRKGENLRIDEAQLNEPTLALIMGISKEDGVEHWEIHKRSINTAKFLGYLEALRKANKDRKIAIYMD